MREKNNNEKTAQPNTIILWLIANLWIVERLLVGVLMENWESIENNMGKKDGKI